MITRYGCVTEWFEYFGVLCTAREKQVAELLMEGKTVTQTGRALGISYVRVIQIREKLAKRIRQAQARARNEDLWVC
jgi:DNA-binding CsgD family transcriptional regulator